MLQPTIVTKSYNWWTERNGAPIVAIVAHNTVGTDSREYLSRGGSLPDGSDRKVSIHSLIRKDGILYRYVPDERGANHAGYGKMPPTFPRINPNRCTIGFELENASNGKDVADPYTEPQLLTMGWEINRIRAEHGPMPIFRHAELDPARRQDTVNLTVGIMEVWATKAREDDVWAAWGPIGRPSGDARTFAIPRAWLVNKALGACVRAEVYSESLKMSMAEFVNGFIWYNTRTKVAHVEWF